MTEKLDNVSQRNVKEGRMVGNRRFKRDHTSGQNGVAKWCVATTR